MEIIKGIPLIYLELILVSFWMASTARFLEVVGHCKTSNSRCDKHADKNKWCGIKLDKRVTLKNSNLRANRADSKLKPPLK